MEPTKKLPQELTPEELEAERERIHCEDLQRRMLEFEINPRNFLRMPRSGSTGR